MDWGRFFFYSFRIKICDVNRCEPFFRKKTSNGARLRSHFLRQNLDRTFIPECAHYLVIAPFKMSFKFGVQFVYIPECFPVIKVPPIVPVASFYFAVVPGSPGWYQLVIYAQFSQYGMVL